MSHWTETLVILACLLGVAAFAGAETASYAVSRVRVDLDARQRRLRSRLVRWLLADATALLVLVLLGNALLVEVATWVAEGSAHSLGLPDWAIEIVLALWLTPLFFFFGDLLPKELARRRPHQYLSATAPFLALMRVLFWPLERVLRGMAWGVTRLFAVQRSAFASHHSREGLLKLLSEGRLSGALPQQAEALAHNVLRLRSTPLSRALIPGERGERLEIGRPPAELYARVAASAFTRLPVVEAGGGVAGYVHQLDVLGEGPEEPVLEAVREVIELDPELPVDKALARLRTSGQRLAVVGTRRAPVGLVTLKDLVEEISGELAAW